MVMPGQFNIRTSRDAKVQEIYERYQRSLTANNAMDFDDLLLSALHLLYQHQDIREKYASRFEHVLVDEFQDTNQVQYEFVITSYSIHYTKLYE